jgi:serine phosphatase RsbU (regulator of sigma subunit)
MLMKELPSLISSGAMDSSIINVDTSGAVDFSGLDSVMAAKKHSQAHFSSGDGTDVSITFGNHNNVGISKGIDPTLLLYLIPFTLILLFSIPFKRYFNKKRKNEVIPEKLNAFVKKYLIVSPRIQVSFVFMVFLIGIIKNIIVVLNVPADQPAEAGLYYNLLTISVISSVLICLFVYFWHRHRVRYLYIEHVYTNEEARVKLSKKTEPRLRYQLYFIHGITTLLPISVIIFYLFLSLSTPVEIGLEKLNPDHIKILIGNYADLIPPSLLQDDSLLFLKDTFYINSFDAFLAAVGILSSFLVSLIYVFFMTRWFTIQITKPISALLQKMEAASDNKEYSHAFIRTGDEFGKLTAGFNNMSDKIKAYIGEIEEMNRDLEKKVVERTLEIQNQKNEIEAQRDEIEAQRDEITAQRDTVTHQKEQIEIIHEEQTSSIRYAKRIQQAMLPSMDILSGAGLDHFIFFLPRDIVSGDFYWSGKVENTMIVSVADCTGHGVPGAFMSMLGMTYLKEIVLKEKIIRPDLILNHLRNEIVRSLKQEAGADQRDGMDIALCTINLDTLEMQFAGANNPLYIVKSAIGHWPLAVGQGTTEANSQQPTANSQLIELKGDKMPIGIHERMDAFTLHTHTLQKGDCIYLFSDGMADQFGGPAGKKFKYKTLKELLTSISHQPMQEQIENLTRTFNEWKGAHSQIDDVTLIGIKL